MGGGEAEGQEPLLGFLGEGTGEAESSGSGLANFNHFGALGWRAVPSGLKPGPGD